MTIRDELKAALVQLDQNPYSLEYSFEKLALEVFRFQFAQNPVYNTYVKFLYKDIKKIDRLEKIPFLPIEFFKNHQVISREVEPQIVFESSGTTSANTSRHFVSDLPFYELMSRNTFETFYGPLTDYHVFALLPSYLERNNSSLVYMVQNFIFHSFSQFGGFYLDNLDEMIQNMTEAAKDGRKILLVGVTFGLLDLAENEVFAEKIRAISDKIIIMETGGMKGRRKEMVREELHAVLTTAFGVKNIHSEYGMTELLSQGYSKGEGVFYLPKTMKILLREINDPFTYLPRFALGEPDQDVKYRGRTGGINVVDLVNIDSCSFIETKDLGSFTPDYEGFKVMGRFDNSDIRGCNLMLN
ncbi:acyl transferase [Lacihabitans sp. CS3-21]|uniref:acyl transferase n=1 Tax=Lacihabitans sp. CS3-21 TaxID=2487332 RepID=UPI0020CCE54F|nr:acyl transferase [Lacihabitans sp. CS3-21]MCP9748617.1 acyl transferase [Lacihabitans sp. CS3-21]